MLYVGLFFAVEATIALSPGGDSIHNAPRALRYGEDGAPCASSSLVPLYRELLQERLALKGLGR